MRRRQVLKARAGYKTQPVATPVEPKLTPVEIYEQMFGKPPHHRMKPETILEKINDGNTSERSA